jgi:Dolichyl-phosphate-mannose-protein mannosyltransferase
MRAMAGRERGSHPLILGGLLSVFFLQMFTAVPIKSPTFDEPAHIGAGLSYLRTGEFKVNSQHPPLLKEIGALPLFLQGARLPVSPDVWNSIGDRPPVYFQWQLGRDVIFGNDPDRVMFWSRLPFIGLAVLLGGLLVAWGRRLLGATAAAGALLLYVFDPTIVAHGPLVATDSGFAALAVLSMFALWSYMNRRSLPRLVACGGALGLMLASKFSAVFLLPVVLALLLGGTRWIPAAAPRRPSTPVDPYASDDAGRRLLFCLVAFVAIALVAALTIEAAYFFPSNPFLYVEGIRRINADHDPTYLAFLGGRFASHFTSYYLVGYLLKEPLPAIVLMVLGVWALLRRGASTAMDRAFLFLPPAILFLTYSLFSDNLGFRYMIPALPFLHLLGGAGLSFLLKEGGVLRKACAAILCLWMVAAGMAIYPDHLSYFNELACATRAPSRLDLEGGWRCGPLWLDDSNVDWGQGLKQLRVWLLAHPSALPLRLGYFGSIGPELYGIEATPVRVEDLVRPVPPGRYALSAHIVARAIGRLRELHGAGPDNWLLHARPVAVVGHAYYIYDLPSSPLR